MLPLGIFSARNFAVGNLATLMIYAGLSVVFFLVVVFLQGIAGYSALEAGLALLPITVIMFFTSRRFGALADRFGPHVFMTAGPLVAAVGLLLLRGLDADPSYVAEVLPGVVVFGVGLAMTVAPLTATVLAGAEREHAGIASAVNNAIARVAGLVGIALVGAVISARFDAALNERIDTAALSANARAAVESAQSKPLARSPVGSVPGSERPRLEAALKDASVASFGLGIGVAAGLVGAGGLISLAGIRNPRREVKAEDCPGGAICGAPRESRPAAALHHVIRTHARA
jgi:hypothetical protein